MNFEIDKTDHNRIAEQFAARLLAEIASESPVTEAAPTPKPRRWPVRLETVSTTVAETPAPETIAPDAPQPVREPRALPDLEILTCEQNTPEWHLARMGIPTASSFDAILTPGKTKTEQKTRRTYMLKLAGELLTGQPMEMVMTRDMERGHILEPEARDLYALQTGANPERVGFLKRGRIGCSPDSLIGTDGGLEIKTKAPHLLIDVILKDEFPEEHKAQVQGALWITGREWWDLAVYWPGVPLFVKRAYRDEAFIANLAAEVDRFNDDLDAIVAQMRERSIPQFAAAA
jgi:YqaJ-like viral recombinase domain